MDSTPFSHLSDDGQTHMVTVGAKPLQQRRAVAEGALVCATETIAKLKAHALPKGDVLTVAQIAGIQAAKRTAELIPLCHPLALALVDVDLRLCENGVAITSKVKTSAETGVEMEALVAVTMAALTVYDMCKAADRGIEIREIALEHKSGGKNGEYRRSKK